MICRVKKEQHEKDADDDRDKVVMEKKKEKKRNEQSHEKNRSHVSLFVCVCVDVTVCIWIGMICVCTYEGAKTVRGPGLGGSANNTSRWAVCKAPTNVVKPLEMAVVGISSVGRSSILS
mmetsp:Transcript_14856/g.16267  ORF Transcript_14856/g.16267 Transcript_14856/m.16267 type:complete len:119 (-) Transcript_14856:1513-1869(-)